MGVNRRLFIRSNGAADPAGSPSAPDCANEAGRVSVRGKFFHLGESKWYLKGLTYGPFAPGEVGGVPLPAVPRLAADFAQVRGLGANCLRVYHLPPPQVLDVAIEHGLRLFVDVPWEKHRCFFEDWTAQRDAREAVRRAARELGGHAGLFALSVVNEVPSDVVRFYGRDRIGRFIGELIDVVKQVEPGCLTTFANYPSTEFLNPPGGDFCCFNVYLEEDDALAGYLDRLQHLAGHRPLILGEFGADSIRQGEARQAELLASHVRRVFRHGLAGSFAFSFTDDWFTGGHQVEGWAFGVTRRDRTEKPAADALRAAWAAVGSGAEDATPLPRVSVVVCSYNGAATLRECLESLVALDYPDFEVILVDDGSTDATPAIAADFPTVRYLRQDNLGLSAARNAGLHASDGEVVAYTDSDCVADPQWLRCLVRAMRDQDVEAIGGPNVSPPSDGWTAKCVAASPGGPSHVMLDDRLAEHVPGCNMAFRRSRLLEIGGFDAQFRQAGDDVDICWRFLDAGLRIGYAPAALVWHHRRASVRAYLRQQAGYGRSEAMVVLKHPKRGGLCGDSTWRGIIYGDGAIGLATVPDRIYHGRFGTGSFQIVYRSNRYTPWIYVTMLEWHAAAAVLAIAGVGWPPLAVLAATMWGLTLVSAVRSARSAQLPAGAPHWCRPLVGLLYVAQPAIRSWHRYKYRLRYGPRLGSAAAAAADVGPAPPPQVKRVSFRAFDQYWISTEGLGREHMLPSFVSHARRAGAHGDFEAEWGAHDVELWPSAWHVALVRTATEELGGARRFTRARTFLHLTPLGGAALAACATWFLTSLVTVVSGSSRWGPLLAVVPLLCVVLSIALDRRRCRRAISGMLAQAAVAAGLEPVTTQVAAAQVPTPEPAPDGGDSSVASRPFLRGLSGNNGPREWSASPEPARPVGAINAGGDRSRGASAPKAVTS